MNFMKKSLLVFCGGLVILGNSSAAMNFNFDNKMFDKAQKTAGEFNKMTNNLKSSKLFKEIQKYD